MPNILRNLKITQVALVDKGANQHAHIMLFKRKSADPVVVVEKETAVKPNFVKRMLEAMNLTDPTAKAAEIAKLSKEADDLELAAHKPDDPDCKCADCMKKREDTEKRLDPAVAKRLEAIEKANADLVTKAAAAEARATAAETLAKSEQTLRKRADMVTILKSFRATPIKLEGDGNDVDLFMKMQEADPKGFERQMEIMKATDNQLAQSALYKNLGSGRTDGAGDAWAQLEAKADALFTKSAGSMSKEQALDKAMEDNPDLVRKHRAEQN